MGLCKWRGPMACGVDNGAVMNNHHGPHLRCERDSKHRTVIPDSVVTANPEVILASWCGRRVDKDKIRARTGWDAIDAVRPGHIYEVKSSYILQPGPASLTEAVRQLHAILAGVVNCETAEGLEPSEPLDPDVLLRRTPAREAAAGEEIST
jgi:iron complex transport system substrate-binding protein